MERDLFKRTHTPAYARRPRPKHTILKAQNATVTPGYHIDHDIR